MAKDPLYRRLEIIGANLSSVVNFNYASDYGYKDKTLVVLADAIARDFPNFFCPVGNHFSQLSPVLDVETPRIIDLQKLAAREREVRTMLQHLRQDSSYKALLQAYRRDDQSTIADLLSDVFVNLSRSTVVHPTPSIPSLYHGVRLPIGLSLEQYVSRCLSIQQQGLKPSPFGIHMDMDRFIRPVFNSARPTLAHGLLLFSFRPSQYTVVVDNGNSLLECRVYTRKLKAPFSLLLKDVDALQSESRDADILEGVDISRTQALDFSERLESHLLDRQIPFQRVSEHKK